MMNPEDEEVLRKLEKLEKRLSEVMAQIDANHQKIVELKALLAKAELEALVEEIYEHLEDRDED